MRLMTVFTRDFYETKLETLKIFSQVARTSFLSQQFRGII